MIIVTTEPVDTAAMFEKIRKSASGSVLLHYAVVKSQAGEKTSEGIRFERAGDMEAELSSIEADIRGRWSTEDVVLARRIGTLNVGDIISLVAVSSPASNDTFEACRHGLERLKKMKTLKKTEQFLDREET